MVHKVWPPSKDLAGQSSLHNNTLILSEVYKLFSRGYLTCDDIIAMTVKGMCGTDLRIQLFSIKLDIIVYRNVKHCNSHLILCIKVISYKNILYVKI